jgi:quercetin dioxygenase-like cupin family protein
VNPLTVARSAADPDTRRVIMRRFGVFLSLMVVVLLGGLAPSAQPIVVAQEATPAADEMMPEGGSFDPVTFATGVSLPSAGDLFVARIGLDPGQRDVIQKSDPSTGILLVESGTLTLQIDNPVTVTRGAGLGAAMATAEASGNFGSLMESVNGDEAVTLAAGDAAYIPANSAGEYRNDGQEPAVALAFIIAPTQDMTGEATPAP